MRILMLGWELPPYNAGGLGVACFELARALAADGAQIDFVLPHAKPLDDPARPFMKVHHAGPDVQTSPAMAYSGDVDAIRKAQHYYKEFVEKHVSGKDNKPDVIHAHDWLTLESGMVAKQLTGVPLVAHVHATEFDRAGGVFGNPLIHEIEQHGLLMADRIIAVSQATKDIIVKHYHIPADKIEIVYNSVNASEIIAQPLPSHSAYAYARSLQAEGIKIVAAVGRLTIQKGLTYYLHAAAQALEKYDKFLFIVAGDGEQRDELILLSAELGISDKVLFPGFVRGAEWRELYDIADIFVMNSVSEPFGLTALEAAVQDTAIILSKQSGVSEILKNVLTCHYWDTARLTDQLIAIATSPGLSHELIAGAKRDFQRVSWQQAARQCLSQYRRGVIA